MNKPKLFVYDWKDEKYYESVLDNVELKFDFDELPKNLEGYEGFFCHHFVPEVEHLIKDAKRKNLPTIISDPKLKKCLENIEKKELDYDFLFIYESHRQAFAQLRYLWPIVKT